MLQLRRRLRFTRAGPRNACGAVAQLWRPARATAVRGLVQRGAAVMCYHGARGVWQIKDLDADGSQLTESARVRLGGPRAGSLATATRRLAS